MWLEKIPPYQDKYLSTVLDLILYFNDNGHFHIHPQGFQGTPKQVPVLLYIGSLKAEKLLLFPGPRGQWLQMAGAHLVMMQEKDRHQNNNNLLMENTTYKPTVKILKIQTAEYKICNYPKTFYHVETLIRLLLKDLI